MSKTVFFSSRVNAGKKPQQHKRKHAEKMNTVTVEKCPRVNSLDDFEWMTVLGCPLSHIFTSSITENFNMVYDIV